MNWFIVFLVFIGYILNIRKNKTCFLIWTITAIYSFHFHIINNTYWQVAIFALYLPFNILGWIVWYRDDQNKKGGV